MEFSKSMTHPSGLLIFGLCVLGITLLTGEQTLADPDVYLHVAVGKWIDLHRAIPLADPFSFTSQGQAWVSHEWLSQWLLFKLHHWSGWPGLVLLGAICFGLTLSIIWHAMQQRLPLIHALALLSLSFACLVTHYNVRPHVLAWPIMAWWTARLMRAVDHDEPPPWIALLAMLMWVNLHASFLLGLVVMAFIAVQAFIDQADRRRSWIVFCLLSFVVCLANPSGWHIYGFVLRTIRLDSLKHLIEWMPPSFQGPNFLALYIVFLLGYGLCGRLRLPWNKLAFLLLLIYQALSHGRYVSILGILAPFFVMNGLIVQENIPRRTPSERPAYRRRVFMVAILASAVAVVMVARWELFRPARWMTPEEGVNTLLSQQITGRGLNHLNYGAYLIYRGIPVFMDGRIDMYGDEGMRRFVNISQSSSPEQLSRELDRWKIQWTLFPKTSQINILLGTLKGWKHFYEDERSVMFVRSENND